ncbi:hypothetical protein ACWDV7_35515 [Streptomyces sp. NPDC003362]
MARRHVPEPAQPDQAVGTAEIPVYAEPGRKGGYRLLDGYRTRLTGLSESEARALFFAGLPDRPPTWGSRPR